jgi:hypothetical protein
VSYGNPTQQRKKIQFKDPCPQHGPNILRALFFAFDRTGTSGAMVLHHCQSWQRKIGGTRLEKQSKKFQKIARKTHNWANLAPKRNLPHCA